VKNQNEYEKCCKAIQLYKEGYGFNKILQLVQRGKGWLSKWLKRFKEQGLRGLKDKNRIFLLIEREWLLNKTIGLSNLSLSRLKAISLLLCIQLQREKLKKGSRCYDIPEH